MMILTLIMAMALMVPGHMGQTNTSTPVIIKDTERNQTNVTDTQHPYAEVPALLPLFTGVVIKPWDSSVPAPAYMNPNESTQQIHPLLSSKQIGFRSNTHQNPEHYYALLPPPPSSACASVPPSGLTQLLRQIVALLPIQQIQQLIANSVEHDHHVRGVMAVLQSSWLHDKVVQIQQSSEYRAISDYICRTFHVDPRDVWEFAKNFVSMSPSLKAVPREMYTGRQGMRGLVEDISDILPRQQLNKLLEGMLISSPDLAETLLHMMSPHFRNMLKKLLELPAYQEIREEMMVYGVPLRELRKLVVAGLGLENVLQYFSIKFT